MFSFCSTSRGWPSRQHNHHIVAPRHRCRGACAEPSARAPRKSVTALIMFFFCSTSRGWPSRQHNHHIRGAAPIGAEVVVPSHQRELPRSRLQPDYVFLLQYITRMASLGTKPPYPWHRAINAEAIIPFIRPTHHLSATTISPRITTTISLSRQRRGNINHAPPFHRAVTAMPTPWAESLPLITTTIGPNHQRRGNITPPSFAEPSAPMQHHGPSHYH